MVFHLGEVNAMISCYCSANADATIQCMQDQEDLGCSLAEKVKKLNILAADEVCGPASHAVSITYYSVSLMLPAILLVYELIM